MIKESTSTRLKQIMGERNLKQIDILKIVKPYCDKYKVKMNKSDLSQYVSGKIEPGQKKLFVLAQALNVSESWLMGYDVSRERHPYSMLEATIMDLGDRIDNINKNMSYFSNFRSTLDILGYQLTTMYKEDDDGDLIDLLENNDYRIEIPHSVLLEKINASKSFIEFQLQQLFNEYPNIPRNKRFDNMTTEEFDVLFNNEEPILNAAHERTDIEVTEEMKKHDDDIMDDDNF